MRDVFSSPWYIVRVQTEYHPPFLPCPIPYDRAFPTVRDSVLYRILLPTVRTGVCGRQMDGCYVILSADNVVDRDVPV